MRVNPEVETKWRDAFGEIHIPETSHCPSQIKPICERILTMCTRLGYAYNTMTQLDRILMLQYWREYDHLNDCLDGYVKFETWFMNHATETELLRRSRQYLVEHHAFWIDAKIAEHAFEAGNKFRQSIRGK
jgi:hypothetical protein